MRKHYNLKLTPFSHYKLILCPNKKTIPKGMVQLIIFYYDV